MQKAKNCLFFAAKGLSGSFFQNTNAVTYTSTILNQDAFPKRISTQKNSYVCVCALTCEEPAPADINIIRVSQNHTFIGMHGVHTVFLAGNHHIYGHIRCVYTVLVNP